MEKGDAMRGRLIVGVSAVVLGLLAPWASASSAQVQSGAITKSSTISGYQLNASALSTLSATIVVPNATCKQGQAVELAVAISGNNGLPPFQFSSFSEGAVDVLCSGKTAHFVTRVIADNSQSKSSLTVKPGQVIVINIKETSNDSLVTLLDKTTKKSIRDNVPTSLGKYHSSFAQFGTQPLDIGSAQAAVPKFSAVAFKDVKVNGKMLATEHPVEYELVYHGKLSVLPTAIGGKENFKLNFKSN
jgi:hypothetical protein